MTERSHSAILMAAITLTGLMAGAGGSLGTVPGIADLGPATAGPIYHAEILIGSDAGFQVAANGVVNTGAAGTAVDPYIIENWTINASSVSGIHVQNTDAHFVIRNVTINGTGQSNNGIDLYDVRNATVSDSTVYDAIYGIRVDADVDMTGIINIVNNTFRDGSLTGVRLAAETPPGRLENVSVLGNIVTGGDYGIQSFTSGCGTRTANVTIAWNTVSGLLSNGIEVDDSCGDIVRDISISDNHVI